MNDHRQNPQRGGDEQRPAPRRSMGPVLLVTTLLLLMLVMWGTKAPKRPILWDEFLYHLYTGKVENPVQDGQRIVGKLAEGAEGVEEGQRDFYAVLPDEPNILTEIRDLNAKEVEHVLVLSTLRERITNGDLKPLRGYPVTLRKLVDPKDPEGPVETRHRFFLDYADNTGTYYAEVVGNQKDQIDMVALSTLLAEEEAEVVAGLNFDTANGLTIKETNNFLVFFLSTFGPILFLGILFWFLFMRQMKGQGQGLLSFGRSRAVLYDKDSNSKVTFADVAGIEEAKDEVGEIIQFLRNPEKFRRIGGRIPRGVLLVGPPGTGKTLLAKAIAGEAGVPFLSISGSDFVEMFVGVGASRVRDLFKQAKEGAPCIVFLDEIDAVGRKRGSGLGGGHDEREQTLNAILVEMDGFGTDEGIIVMAATNRPDVLDPALLRPGRFDREVIIDLPDVKGREAILGVHTTEVTIDPAVDLAAVARGTPGFSGAELAALVNEAAIIAAMADCNQVSQRHFDEARDKVSFGRQKKSRVMDPEDRKITAYHEAGHAVVNLVCDHTEPLHKVTIIPRGMAVGATMYLPEKDRLTQSRRQLLDMMAVAFGGRVAERLFMDDITSGASNDIQYATRIAKMMVTEWGMSERVGAVHLGERSGSEFLGTEFTVGKEHSEATVREIDEEISRILREAEERATKILDGDREGVERVAQGLLLYETINGVEARQLLEGLPPDELRPQPPPLPPVSAPAATPATPNATPEPRTGLLPPGEEGLSPA